MARRNNSHAHAAAVAGSLLALQNGTAKTKRDAAAANGTNTAALKPSRLSALAMANPQIRALFRSDALEITAEIEREDGSKARVSMREALSRGAEKCVANLARLSKDVGTLDKAGREVLAQSERWLRMCRDMGLFRSDQGPALPGELAGTDPPNTASVEWWLADMRKNGQSPGLLTVLPEPEGKTLETEEQAPASNV